MAISPSSCTCRQVVQILFTTREEFQRVTVLHGEKACWESPDCTKLVSAKIDTSVSWHIPNFPQGEAVSTPLSQKGVCTFIFF